MDSITQPNRNQTKARRLLQCPAPIRNRWLLFQPDPLVLLQPCLQAAPSLADTILARQLSHTIMGRNKIKIKSNNLETLLIFHALVIDFTFEVPRRPLLFPSSLFATLQDADKYSLDLQLLELVRASEPEE